MQLIKDFNIFLERNAQQLQVQVQKETEKPKMVYKPNNLVSEICVAMVLLNNEFLDNLLDKGLKARYSENSQVFLTDLKNLLIQKNRLNLGKYQDNKFIEDEEISKISGLFESVEFSIEEDWNTLIDARITSRNIIDKLLLTEKLRSEMIRKIYWIGPNKTKEVTEDIVIETEDGRQFSFHLNKNLSTSKSGSFLSFADDLIGERTDLLFKGDYLEKWNKLIQNWVRVNYENSNPTIQAYFEKFIQPDRILNLSWFGYFEVKHIDPKFQHLGEYFKEFDKNIVYFSDFLTEVWKNKETLFKDVNKAESDWNEKKIFLLNSKILENLLTQSILKNNKSDVKKTDDGMKRTSGSIKMKLMKTIVEKLGCVERDIYYLANKGNSFHLLPSRSFFRDFYDEIDIKFDYHVKLSNLTKAEDNNFKIKVEIDLDEKRLIGGNIIVKFTGSELSDKLSASFKFEPVDEFNFIVTEKIRESLSE